MGNLVCGQCGESLDENSKFAINAFQKVWHKECFKCEQCGERIFSFAKFFDNGEGKPKCAVCYKKKAPTCGVCKKTIEGEFRSAHDDTFHEACFVCAHCKKPFGEEGKFCFFIFFCLLFFLFSSLSILGSFEDEGKLWHLECFGKANK